MSITFKVGLTGPDHEPTASIKWFAQVHLTTYDLIPIGLQTYKFGPTPEKAMQNLSEYLQLNGVTL